MFESLEKSLKSWSANNDERQKLQQTYIASAVILVLLAGVVGLFNYDSGQQLLLLALAAALVYLVNAVVWALVSAAVFQRLTTNGRSAASKPATTKKTTKKK